VMSGITLVAGVDGWSARLQCLLKMLPTPRDRSRTNRQSQGSEQVLFFFPSIHLIKTLVLFDFDHTEIVIPIKASPCATFLLVTFASISSQQPAYLKQNA